MRGVGAFTVNGKMVDGPFVRRAEAILELARKLHLLAPEERTIQCKVVSGTTFHREASPTKTRT